ncbi:hypothetical protein F2981_28955 (plasmid) [Sinorhizobium meliloti]|nr:hypothetical protein [Sinorhizobium meliloti]
MEEDLRSVDFKPYRQQRIDLLVGGLPCQPYSEDGKGLGKDDPAIFSWKVREPSRR